MRIAVFLRRHGVQCPQPNWVARMRAAKKRNRLTKAQIQELDQIDFTWSIDLQPAWEQRFKRLEAFQEKQAHCNVPWNYPLNPALGHWVINVPAKAARHACEGKDSPLHRPRLQSGDASGQETGVASQRAKRVRHSRPESKGPVCRERGAGVVRLGFRVPDWRIGSTVEALAAISGPLAILRFRGSADQCPPSA